MNRYVARGLSVLGMPHMFAGRQRSAAMNVTATTLTSPAPPTNSAVQVSADRSHRAAAASDVAQRDSAGRVMNSYVFPRGKTFRSVRSDLFAQALKSTGKK